MNLGRYFTQKGIKLSGFYGRNVQSTKEASKITNSNYYDTLEKLIKDEQLKAKIQVMKSDVTKQFGIDLTGSKIR